MLARVVLRVLQLNMHQQLVRQLRIVFVHRVLLLWMQLLVLLTDPVLLAMELHRAHVLLPRVLQATILLLA